jgi:hypothetical protein
MTFHKKWFFAFCLIPSFGKEYAHPNAQYLGKECQHSIPGPGITPAKLILLRGEAVKKAFQNIVRETPKISDYEDRIGKPFSHAPKERISFFDCEQQVGLECSFDSDKLEVIDKEWAKMMQMPVVCMKNGKDLNHKPQRG